MQIRVVLTVFRAEMARLNRVDPVGAGFDAGRLLRLRSIELLDHARARLNGEESASPNCSTSFSQPARRSAVRLQSEPSPIVTAGRSIQSPSPWRGPP
jgi:hypothetical protein